MKWSNLGAQHMITTEMSTHFKGGHTEYVRLALRQQIEKLLNKMSDMDIPDKLEVFIGIHDGEPIDLDKPEKPFWVQ